MLHSGSPMDNQLIHYQLPSVPYSFINTDNLWNKSERPSICGLSFPSVTPTLTLELEAVSSPSNVSSRQQVNKLSYVVKAKASVRSNKPHLVPALYMAVDD